MSMVDISQAERRIAERVDAGVTHQLAVSDTGTGVAFSNVGEMTEFAKMMAVANSGVRKHLRGNVGACLAILTQALEWGMSPFAVANKSYFVNDMIAFESQLVQAVILRRAPIRGRIKFEYDGEGQSRRCRAWARLREDDEVVDYLSPAIKDIKVKNSPLWVGDPDQQLAYFSGRSLCRRHFPDVLLGIYAEDEIERETPAVGPDRARDVSPPKTLSGKLDMLVSSGGKSDAVPAAESSAADLQGSDQGGSDLLGQGETPLISEPTNPAHDAVLTKLRPAAGKGTAPLRRAIQTLSEADEALLTDADREALGQVAADADAAKGGQG